MMKMTLSCLGCPMLVRRFPSLGVAAICCFIACTPTGGQPAPDHGPLDQGARDEGVRRVDAVADRGAAGDATADVVDLDAPASSRAVVFPHPVGIDACLDYRVFVEGMEVFCYQDYRLNTQWPPNDVKMKVSPQGFAIFDFAGTVHVRVQLASDLYAARAAMKIAPAAAGVAPSFDAGELVFEIDQPGNYTVDPFGDGTRVLHLFTNAPEVAPPDSNDPDVLYFGPGVHDIEQQIVLESGKTLYLAGGAVLRPLISESLPGWEDKVDTHYTGLEYTRSQPAITSRGATGVTIKGRGVISGARALPAGTRFVSLFLTNGVGARIEDVVFVQPSLWTLHLYNCTGCVIDGARVLGYFTNSDGIVLNSCTDTTVKNAFVHTGDDGLEIKTSTALPSRNVTFESCQTWVDAGTPLGLTHEIHQPVEQATFKDITVLRYTQPANAAEEIPYRGAILVKPAFGGAVRDVAFERITIEDHRTSRPLIVVHNGKYNIPGQFYGLDTDYSQIAGLRFVDVVAEASGTSPEVWVVDGEGGLFTDISFERVTINGALLTGNSAELVTQGAPQLLFAP